MTSETFAQLFPLFCLLLGLASLAVFGVAWNAYVARQEAHGADEGRTWLYVVIGCAVTQAVAGLVDLALDWNAGVLGFLCFAAIELEREMDRRGFGAVAADILAHYGLRLPA